MSIEFHEVRRGEVADALAFAQSLGRTVNRATLVPRLSLMAINSHGERLGCALHTLDASQRRVVAVDVAPGVHVGLARLLIDRAIRKAASTGLSCASITIAHDEAERCTWREANWMTRFVEAA